MEKVTKYTWDDFEADIRKMSIFMTGNRFDYIYAIVKGGLPLGVKLANVYSVPLCIIQLTKAQGHITIDSPYDVPYSEPSPKILIVDDISDSGKTLRDVLHHFSRANVKTLTIHYKETSLVKPDFFVRKAKNWIEYPWE